MTTIHSADAEGLTLGALSLSDLRTFLGDASLSDDTDMRGLMSVVDVDGNQVVRVTLPADGIDRCYWYADLATTSDEAYIFYDLTINGDTSTWDPGFGGKLPGLGGAITGTPPSGGVGASNTGWDGRMMWLGWKDGAKPYSWVDFPNELIGYPYHPTQPGPYGNNQQTNHSLVPGQTHRLGCYYKMNTVTVDDTDYDADGVYRIYLDGAVVFESTTWVWRKRAAATVNFLSFACFRGGSTSSWEVPTSTTFDFDNLIVSTTLPETEPVDPVEVSPQGLGGLVLASQTTTTLTPTLAAPSVADPVLHTVAISHPTPTLSNGRPL